MKTVTIPELAIKLFGMVLIIIGLPKIPILIYWIIIARTAEGADLFAVSAVKSFLPGMYYVITGFVLYFMGRGFASRFILKEEQTIAPLTIEKLQGTLYSCIGLFLALYSIPAIVIMVMSSRYCNDRDLMTMTVGIGHLIIFVLGISLFFGAKGLVGFRNYIRNAGTGTAS
jgi:hypothetical protein